MTYKIGDYTIPAGHEPERVDLSTQNQTQPYPMPFEPFNMMDDYGLGLTSLVIQGYTTSRTVFENIMGEYKKAGQKIIQYPEWDGELRRVFAFSGGQGRKTKVGQRKGMYDYTEEFVCADPFEYSTDLEFLAPVSVGTTDVTFSMTAAKWGQIPAYPIFYLRNASGGSLSNFKFYAGDVTSSVNDAADKIVASITTFENNHSIVLYPLVYYTREKVYLHQYLRYLSATVDLENDDLKDNGIDSDTGSGSVSGFWPKFRTSTGNIYCKVSNATNTAVNVGMQWSKTY